MTSKRWLAAASVGIMAWMAAGGGVRAETTDIVGTGDGMVILMELAKAFEQSHPGDSVMVPESIGSSGGIKSVGNDKNLIGRVARHLKETEKPYGLTYFPIAKFPVVFFVNKDVGALNLTHQQINDIFSGITTNWKTVGGRDAKIRVVRREDGDSSLKNLQATFPGFKDIAITKRSKTMTLTKENFEFIANKPGAIGFGPYADAVKADVNILNIDNKKPTDTGYPSFGVLALIYKEVNRKGVVSVFIDFMTTPRAQKAILNAHAVPYEE